ncbi:MAG: C1 family peptidase [Pirellulaceae bacterium]|nr:C1 family peptidase [Pirellulaceae bacterium]
MLGSLPASDSVLPRHVDLRDDDEGLYFSPPDNQGRLHASSTFACLALIEYFERRTMGRTFDGSALFLYEMARKLAGVTGNSSVGIRATLKALRQCGAPPEEMWPYRDAPLDEAPAHASLLGFSQPLSGMVYFRLDPPEQSGSHNLALLKSFLAAGFPVALGFTVPRSLTDDGLIPYRPKFDSYRGGQTVLAVGYDDQQTNANHGALLVRSSWGPNWGDAGYGWLPYAMVTHRQAADLWTVVSKDWISGYVLNAPTVSVETQI